MRDKLIMQAIELREKAKEMKNIADIVLKGIACSKDMSNSESLNVLFSDKQKDKARILSCTLKAFKGKYIGVACDDIVKTNTEIVDTKIDSIPDVLLGQLRFGKLIDVKEIEEDDNVAVALILEDKKIILILPKVVSEEISLLTLYSFKQDNEIESLIEITY